MSVNQILYWQNVQNSQNNSKGFYLNCDDKLDFLVPDMATCLSFAQFVNYLCPHPSNSLAWFKLSTLFSEIVCELASQAYMSSRMVTTFVMSAQLLCKLFCERNLLQLVAYLHIKQIVGRRKCLKFVRPNIGRRGEVGYGGGCGVYALFVRLSSLEKLWLLNFYCRESENHKDFTSGSAVCVYHLH